MSKFDTLIFGGGGPDGAMFVGAVRALSENVEGFDLNSIKTFVGSSVGSVMAVMFAIRMNFDDIESSMKLGFCTGALSRLDISNILNMPKRLGIDDGNRMIDWLSEVLSEHGIDRNITFRRFHELLGRRLAISVTNLTHGRNEFMSVETSPNLPVLMAVRMSTSVPLLYTPVMWNGCLYIDGDTIVAHYLNVVSSDNIDPNRTIALNIVDTSSNRDYQDASTTTTSLSIPNFQTYLLMLYRVLISNRQRDKMTRRPRYVIDIPSLIMSDNSPIRYNFMSLQIISKTEVDKTMATFVDAGHSATCRQIFSSAESSKQESPQ